MTAFHTNALVILAACLFLFLLWYFLRWLRTGKLQIDSVLLIIFISCIFLFAPQYWANYRDSETSFFRSLAFTLYYSLKALTGAQDIKSLEAFAGIENIHIQQLYLVLNYIILVLAPFLTSSLLISMLGDWADRIRYRFRLNRDYHVFSELNENSLQLAKHIRASHRWDAIVFCKTKNCSTTLLAQSKALGAIHLYASCNALNIPTLRHIFQFYLISTDEDRNLHDTEQLIYRHRGKIKKPILINAFAESGTGIQVVESMQTENIHVHFVDSTAMLCNELMLNHPLYAGLDGRKRISVAIVGCDKTGIRMLKTIAWSGQIAGYGLKIRIYDKNAAAVEQRFLVQCPELKKSCDIEFISANTDSEEFEQRILQHSSDATYIVTAMGDDEVNVDVAVRLYQLFRIRNRYGSWSPKILARTRSSVKSELFISHNNNYLKKRNIYLFGRAEEAFSKSTLFFSQLERLAFAVHLCYNGLLPSELDDAALLEHLKKAEVRKAQRDFMQLEYERRSSMATALHISAKMFGGKLITEGEDALSDEAAEKLRKALASDNNLLRQLAKNEHQRWNCFMRSEGYRHVSFSSMKRFYSDPAVHSHKDNLSKRHLCITDWKSLKSLSKKCATKLDPPLKKDFRKSDIDIVRSTPDIIRFANRLKETNLDRAVFLGEKNLHVISLECSTALEKLRKTREEPAEASVTE